MKKNLLLVLVLFISASSVAKKVKFSVNMTGQTINITGIHVMGDFQTLIGCTVDFDAACTQMTQETADTNIYSVIVDIPAFAKYEYDFVNGDQGYEVENVPWESQVGFVSSILNTNRWIYIDSLADDTTDIGAILFSGNAPAGLTLVRFKVDMTSVLVNPAGVHAAGNFNGWNSALNFMWSFNSPVYEVIDFLPADTYEFKYHNGINSADAETVPDSCDTNNNRQLVLNVDTILQCLAQYPVTFSQCSPCDFVGVDEINSASAISIYPNPAKNKLTIDNGQLTMGKIEIYDAFGKRVLHQPQTANCKLQTFDVSPLNSGIYVLRISDSANRIFTSQKLVIE